jgi:small-conductance mechanosensitive channel
MSMLEQWDLLGNSLRAWIASAVIATALFIILIEARRIIIRRLDRLCCIPGDHHIAPITLRVVRATSRVIILLLSLYVASLGLVLPVAVNEWLGRFALFVLLVQVALWGNALILAWLEDYEAQHIERNAAGVTTMHAVSVVLRLAFLTLVVLVALDNLPGIEITTLLASLGIGGIAVALAVQNVLSDLFASLSIALDKPVVIGDFISLGDVRGTVQHVGLKTTRIRSLTGEQLVIGNADLLRCTIHNYKRMDERRISFRIGVHHETDYEMVSRIPDMLREIVEAQEPVRFDRAHFAEYGEYALIFEVVYFVLVPDYVAYMDIQQAINLEILRRFEMEGIKLGYPTRTVYMAQG